MTVAFNSATAKNVQAVASPQTFNVTVPAGTKGVALLIEHPTVSTDLITGVTLGGQALTRGIASFRIAGQLGASYIYHKGSGIPTGVQAVSIARGDATTEIMAAMAFMDGTGDIEGVDVADTDGSLINPAVPLAFGGRSCLGLCVMHSGLPDLADAVDFTGQTRIADNDFGVNTGFMSRRTSVGTADVTMGYTTRDPTTLAALQDHTALCAMAFAEVEAPPAAPDVIPPTGGSSAPRSSTWIQQALQGVRNLQDLVNLLAAELPKFSQAVMTYERVALLPYGTTVRPGGNLTRLGLIVATNTTAFTIANPTSPREGAELTLDIMNNSGGTMGTITWGSEYQLVTTFTNPANTKHRIISFVRTADARWRERFRSSGDLS